MGHGIGLALKQWTLLELVLANPQVHDLETNDLCDLIYVFQQIPLTIKPYVFPACAIYIQCLQLNEVLIHITVISRHWLIYSKLIIHVNFPTWSLWQYFKWPLLSMQSGNCVPLWVPLTSSLPGNSEILTLLYV